MLKNIGICYKIIDTLLIISALFSLRPIISKITGILEKLKNIFSVVFYIIVTK